MAFERRALRYPSARSALAECLSTLAAEQPLLTVLLPSYIGWTAAEGSGVFDPVYESGLDYEFYRVDSRLDVDIEDLGRLLDRAGHAVVVLIHYFGRPDESAAEIARLALEYGALLIEDEAHALLSDLVGGVCGRFGHAAIGSLHKLFPISEGGVLLLDSRVRHMFRPVLTQREPAIDLVRWDLQAIAARRRENAALYMELLGGEPGALRPLWGNVDSRIVPQSFPVVVDYQVDRDVLHARLRDAGVGVTSLYYQMITQIDVGRFAESHRLSRSILNLPLHQELTPSQIRGVAAAVTSVAGEMLRAAP